MRLAILKKDFSFRRHASDRSVVVSKGTTIQVTTDHIFTHWLGGYYLRAPGDLVYLMDKDEVDEVIEFLDDETSHS